MIQNLNESESYDKGQIRVFHLALTDILPYYDNQSNNCNRSTLRFFFKFVLHIVQKYIDQMSPPENKKCSSGKVFGIKPPLNLATFEEERP